MRVLRENQIVPSDVTILSNHLQKEVVKEALLTYYSQHTLSTKHKNPDLDQLEYTPDAAILKKIESLDEGFLDFTTKIFDLKKEIKQYRDFINKFYTVSFSLFIFQCSFQRKSTQ